MPLAYVDTNYTLPTGCTAIAVGTVPSGGCKIITVNAGQSFQTALNQARRGDIIQLQANASFTGPFELPDKGAGAGWVYVVSSALGNLPGPGNRLNPNLGGTCNTEGALPCGVSPNAQLSDLPKIMSGGSTPYRWLATAHGADRYRFIGIEFATTPGQQVGIGIRLHETINHSRHASLAEKTSDIIFDRCLMRGSYTAPYAGRPIGLAGDRHAVINSYISGWVDDDTDTQAVLAIGYASVFAVINNYLEASGENVYTDGAEVINGTVYVPSDGEIRGNYLRKLSEWNSRGWNNTKNQFEMKSGQRILFEGNIIDTAYHLAQETSINIKIGDENTINFVHDVTVRNNVIRHVANGIKICVTQCNSSNNPNVATRIAVYNNVFDHVDGSYGTPGSDGHAVFGLVTGPVIIVDHNTFISSHEGINFLVRGVNVPNGQELVITNNVMKYHSNPLTATEVLTASSAAIYTNNVIVGGNCTNYPAGNRCPTSWAGVGFNNFNNGNGGDYNLSPSSPYKGVGSDPFGVGTFDPGANVGHVNAATGCAVTGQCGSGETGDVTPPSVAVTAPGNGATVGGTTTLSASAADNEGVAGVQFMIDGNPVGGEDTSSPYSISWNSSTVPNGSRTISARARDGAGNSSVSSITVNVQNAAAGDGTPPSVSVTAPGNGATVSSTITVSANATDNVGVAGVQFLLNGSNLGSEDTSGPYSVSWNTASVSNGTHTLTARARDAAGNVTTSPSITVNVQNSAPAPAPGDTSPPSVSISAPVNGATLSGNVTVAANASDNVGVVGVQFLVDGLNLGAEDTSSPYSVSWPTTNYANGTHTLSARARDAAGNMTTSAVFTVAIKNQTSSDTTPPNVSITSPTNGAIVSGNVTVSASASDNVAVVGVQFRLDGQNLGPELIAAPYTMLWNAAGVSAGSHTLTAVARDAAGNSRTANAIGVTVQNADASTDTTPPNVVMTAPSNGATVSGSVLLAANATDNVAVAAVQFVVDGVNFGAPVIAPPFSRTWDASAVAAGSHVLSAVAKDAAGNTRAAVAISVNVKAANTAPGAQPRGDVQRVSWTSLVNTKVYLWKLRKTEGCDNCADAGAISSQRVSAGDGYVEIEGTASQKVYYVGWGASSPGTALQDLEFALRLNGRSADVYEAGSPRLSQPYNDGDLLRISVNGGLVTYLRNGTPFYTSQRAPVYPLSVRAVLMDRRAEVSRAYFWRAGTASGTTASSLTGASGGGTSAPPRSSTGSGSGSPSNPRSPRTDGAEIQPRSRPALVEGDRISAGLPVETWALGLLSTADAEVKAIYLYGYVGDNSTDEPIFLGAVTRALEEATVGEWDTAQRKKIQKAVAELTPGTYKVTAFAQLATGAPYEIGILSLVIR